MQIEGTKLIFIINISVLDFFKFTSRMPQIAQILVSTFNIFQGGMPPDPPRNFLFFFLEQFQALIQLCTLPDAYLFIYAHRSQWSKGHLRPFTIALCSGLLWPLQSSWSLAVLALLQCLTFNCCKASLSSSSSVGSRSGLGEWYITRWTNLKDVKYRGTVRGFMAPSWPNIYVCIKKHIAVKQIYLGCYLWNTYSVWKIHKQLH